jgi:putative Holliday junction resolvase
MRVAALDLGTVRVGVSISDDLGIMAHPRPALDARNRKSLLEAVAAFAREEDIERFIVGLPLDDRGEQGPAAHKALAFAEQVHQTTRIPVDLWDERFTTVEAHRKLREGGRNARAARARVDSAAACIMLQAWLDRHRERNA